jgi:FixJ family two-component response regulator
MSPRDPVVFVVDDDEAVRESLELLISSVGLEVRSSGSAREFLESYDGGRPGCLVLDVRMPGMSGLELQERLNEMGSCLPVIFITGHGDVPVAVSAMRAGAVDFLQKPFRDQELLDRIHQSIQRHRGLLARLDDVQQVRERMSHLTRREREVMALVVEGAPNKAIAYDLGLSERTVEIHRSRVMKKMDAGSLAELVQLVLSARAAEE